MAQTKNVDIVGPDGESFTVKAPENASEAEVNAWLSTEGGQYAINQARKKRWTQQFINGKPPNLAPPTESDKMSPLTAYGGQFGHTMDKMLHEGVLPLMGVEPGENTQQRLDQGRAFVDTTREQGYPNLGGTAAEMIPAGLAAFFPVPGTKTKAAVNATRLGRALWEAGKQGVVAGATNGEDRLSTAATAAAGSLMGDALLRALSRFAKPVQNPAEDVKFLVENDVFPNPMASGPMWLKNLEDKFTSYPGIGDAIDYGRAGASDELAAQLYRNIGVKGAKAKDVGDPLHQQAQAMFNQRFTDSLNGMVFDPKDYRLQEIFNQAARGNQLNNTYLGMLDKDLNKFLSDYNLPNMPITGARTPAASTAPQIPLTSPVSQPPQMLGGKQVQSFTQRLGKRASRFGKPTDTGESQDYSDALRQAQRGVLDLVGEQNLGVSPKDNVNAFLNTNRDFANYSWMKKASGSARAQARGGVAGPGEYLKAFNDARKHSSTLMNQALQGKAGDTQRLLRAGKERIANSYPDSGTTGRLALGAVLTGAGSLYAPTVAIPAAVLGGLLHTPAGRKYLHGRWGASQELLSNALRNDSLRTAGQVGGAMMMQNPLGYDDNTTPWEK